MKKVKILFLTLLFSFNIVGVDAYTQKAPLSKNTVETLQFWNFVFSAADMVLDDEYKFWPNLDISFRKCFAKGSTDYRDNTSYYIPGLISKTLASALEENEDLLSLFINAIIRVHQLKNKISRQSNYAPDSQELKYFKTKEAFVFFTEKFFENATNYSLNNSIKDNRILKRFFKIITFSVIAASGAKLRQLISSSNLESYLPHASSTAVDKFIELALVESIAEILERYFIDATTEQKKEQFNQTHQSIIEANIDWVRRKK